MTTKHILSSWSWRDSSGVGLSGRTEIPTNIHLDLLAANAIADPFLGENEANIQWIHSKTWVYTTTFEALPVASDESVDLVLEGLDTYATVWLNGEEVLKCDNMFVSHRIDVRRLVRGQNELEITFASAYDRGESLRASNGNLLCWNGHYGRVNVRKAQYHFGWDWGPSLVTCGPWKPVFLERYTCRIGEIRVNVNLSDSLAEANLLVSFDNEPKASSTHADIQLIDPDGVVLDLRKPESNSASYSLDCPRLWYPHTHGQQPLYKVIVTLRSSTNAILDSRAQPFGIRHIELVQSPLKEGTSFYFRCNKIPMFMGGSNWIPGDSFLPRMTAEKYKRWIDLAIRGNQNMLRVWGGGIYEDDAFYEECDRRGMFIWQDFCFACGQYPSNPEFIESVKLEAAQAIKRLRGHASLVIWAGNNEDYQIANEGLHHDMSMPEEKWPDSSFGARTIYERILPDLVREHAPGSLYWPGSPFGGSDNNSDRTVGDVHIWNVSSGMLLPYQRYPDVAGRFVSEFGMLSCPSMTTVTGSFFGASKDFHPQSREFEFHCKASSHEKRMLTCMGENFRMSFDLETYIYLSQLVQSEAMYYAFRGWRRQFEGRECGGALVWQTNDCWPAVSWAIIDHFERPKMAYYAISRALRPVVAGIARRQMINRRPNLLHEAFCAAKTKAEVAGVIAHATPHIYPPRESKYSVWVANSTNITKEITVIVRFISVESGNEVCDPLVRTAEAKETGTTEVVDGQTPEEEPTVVFAQVLTSGGEHLSYDVDWPQPLKHMTFPDRQLKVERRGAEELVVSASKPVKGLFFTNDGVQWSDNAIDVIPGHEVTIVAKGLKEKPTWIYYGMED